MLFFFLVPLSARTVAQTNGSADAPLVLPLPLWFDWSESINPLAQNKLVAESYKILAGTKNLKFQYSNQTPVFLGGKQFQGLPGGYKLVDFALSRTWGTVYGFRSVGYISHMMRPESARNLTGAAIELPKSFLGTNLSGYLLHATPREPAHSTGSNPTASPGGAQIGFTLARALKKRTRLQMEWTQTYHSSPGSQAAHAARARRGLYLRIDSTVAKTDLNFKAIDREEGLANPAVPIYGPAKRTFWLNVRRKLRQHELQYSSQSDNQRPISMIPLPIGSLQEHSLRWTYIPRRLPQISASYTWNRQRAASKPGQEETYRFSLSKTMRRLNASVALLRGIRFDAGSSRSQWERTALAGDAIVEIRKDNRIHFRYETSELRQQPILSQLLSISSVRIDTHVTFWRSRLSLVPALDVRYQGGSSPALDLSTFRIALAMAVKLPRRFPGNELLINVGSQHIQSMGRPDQNSNELMMRWNFKRL